MEKPIDWHGRWIAVDPELRFWPRVSFPDNDNGCWSWTGALIRGYGRLAMGRGVCVAHRFSWELHFGKIPNGLNVLHDCDNKRCVNPTHLHLGTQSDNTREAYERGLIKRKSQ